MEGNTSRASPPFQQSLPIKKMIVPYFSRLRFRLKTLFSLCISTAEAVRSLSTRTKILFAQSYDDLVYLISPKSNTPEKARMTKDSTQESFGIRS